MTCPCCSPNPGCSCSTNLGGVTTIGMKARWMGKNFIIGPDTIIEETAGGIYTRWTSQVNVVFGTYPIFTWYVAPESNLGLAIFSYGAEVRCVDNVWYFNLSYFNSFGYGADGTVCDNCLDSKVGIFEQCVAAAGCNGREPGEPIPIGSPSQLASIPPYPIVAHADIPSCDGVSCPEKPAVDFELSENC